MAVGGQDVEMRIEEDTDREEDDLDRSIGGPEPEPKKMKLDSAQEIKPSPSLWDADLEDPELDIRIDLSSMSAARTEYKEFCERKGLHETGCYYFLDSVLPIHVPGTNATTLPRRQHRSHRSTQDFTQRKTYGSILPSTQAKDPRNAQLAQQLHTHEQHIRPAYTSIISSKESAANIPHQNTAHHIQKLPPKSTQPGSTKDIIPRKHKQPAYPSTLSNKGLFKERSEIIIATPDLLASPPVTSSQHPKSGNTKHHALHPNRDRHIHPTGGQITLHISAHSIMSQRIRGTKRTPRKHFTAIIGDDCFSFLGLLIVL